MSMKKIGVGFVMMGAVAACAAAGEETESSSDALRASSVRLYTDAGYGGKLTSLAIGDHDLVAEGFDDRASSLRIFGDVTVTVFENRDLTGASHVYAADATDLGALDGKVSAVRIAKAGTTPPSVDAGTTSTDAGTTPTSAVGGWASVAGLGVTTTTGGGNASAVTATTLAQLNALVGDATPRVVRVSGRIKGDVSVGSNKTIVGAGGGTIEGHIDLKGSVNVIVQDLAIVGYDYTDNSDCQSGADAVTITKNAHHIWFDHCAVSNGSDGNLDVTHASDFITVSWTKFFYTGARAGGHQFSNLIGHTDDNPEDVGHLRVTFHHDWWADNVGERMPRVRYGHVHLFDNLLTAKGNNYCVRAGVEAAVLVENNAFIGVNDPFDLAEGDVLSKGNLFSGTKGNTKDTGKAFVPPYAYLLEDANGLATSVPRGAGPR